MTITTETILLQPDQALKLQQLHSDVMYEQAAERGWCHTRTKLAQERYKQYAESLGFQGGLRTDRLAMTIWYNYDAIYQAQQDGKSIVKLNIDLDSDYLIRLAA